MCILMSFTIRMVDIELELSLQWIVKMISIGTVLSVHQVAVKQVFMSDPLPY